MYNREIMHVVTNFKRKEKVEKNLKTNRKAREERKEWK